MKFFVTTFQKVWTLLVGLFITGRYFCSSRLTVRYPRQTIEPEILRSYRGPLELVGLDNDPTTPRCISCMMCVTACPSNCISIVKSPAPKLTPEEEQAMAEAKERGEKVKRPAGPKYPARYTYDFSLCSLCACCVESCPADAIRFSHHIYESDTNRHGFKYELVDSLAQGKLVIAKPPVPARPAQPEQGATPSAPSNPTSLSTSGEAE